MEWFSQSWVWVLIVSGMFAMHIPVRAQSRTLVSPRRQERHESKRIVGGGIAVSVRKPAA